MSAAPLPLQPNSKTPEAKQFKDLVYSESNFKIKLSVTYEGNITKEEVLDYLKVKDKNTSVMEDFKWIQYIAEQEYFGGS